MRSIHTHTPFDHIHLLFFNLHMHVIHSFFSKGNRSPSGPLVHITNDSPNFSFPPQRSSDGVLDSSIIISPCTRWFNAVVYSANPLRSSQSDSEHYRSGIHSHRSRIPLSGLQVCYIQIVSHRLVNEIDHCIMCVKPVQYEQNRNGQLVGCHVIL